MDKELDKMEFKLNGLSALYRVETRQAVQSPLYLNTLEAFQKWDRFHRLTHKSTKLPQSTPAHSSHGIFHLSMFTWSNKPTWCLSLALNKLRFLVLTKLLF